MAGQTALLADRRDAVSSCADALRDLHTVLFQCGSSELGNLAGELAELRALCGAGLADVIAEARTRGVIENSHHASTAAWIADVAWHSRREATTLAKTSALLRSPDLDAVVDSVRQVDVDPGTAVVVATEFDKLAPDLREEAKPIVLDQFLAVGAEHGPAGVRRLRQESWPGTASRASSRNTRNAAAARSTCLPGGKPPPGCGTTGSPWTMRAARCWKPRSVRCPPRNPTPRRGNVTCGRWVGGAAQR